MNSKSHADLLRKLIHSADWPALESFIHSHPTPNLYTTKLPCGQTPLQLASLLGATRIVQTLLSLPLPCADSTCHLHAARNGHATVLALLLPSAPPHSSLAQCNCHVHSPAAGEALHMAAWHAHDECVELILAALCSNAKKAALAWTGHDGGTSLHAAALSGNVKMVSRLLNAGANVSTRDEQGMRAVDWARRFVVASGGRGHDVVVMLVDAEPVRMLKDIKLDKDKVEEDVRLPERAPCVPKKVRAASGKLPACHAV